MLLNKPDVARRQINAAIRMTFAGEDPVAIHTVAGAARQLVRDLCEHQGGVGSYGDFLDWIAPGHEREFWAAINQSANFLKHADKDPTARHELKEDESDFVIILTCRWYRDLGFEPTPEMQSFALWYAGCNPKFVSKTMEKTIQGSGMGSSFAEVGRLLSSMSRHDQIISGAAILRQRMAQRK